LKVLAVIDGTERTGRIIDYALRLRCLDRTFQVVILGVVPEPPTDRLRGHGSFKKEEIHGGLKENLRQRAIPAIARRLDHEKIRHVDRVEVGDPAATILRVAREEDAHIILLGDSPSNLFKRLLSVIGLSVATAASQVVQQAAMPVMVVK